MSKIVTFPGSPPVRAPLTWFCRLGRTGHKQLATLHASGGLPVDRAVVDASVRKWQQPLVIDLLGEIARFAVEAGVDTVLAPCHYLGDKGFPGWLGVDHDACLGLRQKLDAKGGRSIAIDYNLILPAARIKAVGRRGEIVESLADLPIDDVWVRVGSFGHDASPSATRGTIESLAAMHDIGRPIVADYAGGMSALAALAFGAVSAVAQSRTASGSAAGSSRASGNAAPHRSGRARPPGSPSAWLCPDSTRA